MSRTIRKLPLTDSGLKCRFLGKTAYATYSIKRRGSNLFQKFTNHKIFEKIEVNSWLKEYVMPNGQTQWLKDNSYHFTDIHFFGSDNIPEKPKATGRKKFVQFEEHFVGFKTVYQNDWTVFTEEEQKDAYDLTVLNYCKKNATCKRHQMNAARHAKRTANRKTRATQKHELYKMIQEIDHDDLMD